HRSLIIAENISFSYFIKQSKRRLRFSTFAPLHNQLPISYPILPTLRLKRLYYCATGMAIGMYEPGATLDCPARSAEAPFDTFLAATQELLDILPGAVCLCDAEGRVARHNRRAADFWQSPAAPDQAEHAPCLSACLFL